MEMNTTEHGAFVTYPIQFIEQEQGTHLPVPLVRVTCCGMMMLEVLKEVVRSDPPLGCYEVVSTQDLRGRGAVPSMMLLKLLASQPHRFATKDWLATQMQQEMERGALVRLDTMASQLRKQFRGLQGEDASALGLMLVAYLRNGRGSGPGYQLAPYPLIWLDTDALAWNVTQAARMQRFGEDALPWWERAYALASRGAYLPDDPYSEWAIDKRAEVEGALRQCVHALHHLYLAHHATAGGQQALLLLRSYWLTHQTDEDALRPLMELLGREERYQEAEDYYQQLVRTLTDDLLDGEEPSEPDARTQDLREFLRTKQLRREPNPFSTNRSGEIEQQSLSPITAAILQGITLAAQTLSSRGVFTFSAITGLSQRRDHFINFAQYERNIRSALQIHRTSNAQNVLHDLNNDIDEMEILEDKVEGDILSRLRTLLIANDLLATKIVKDQKQYALAYAYANHAVRVAKSLPDEPLLATAQYARGCIRLEWGLFGVMKHGRFQQDSKKIQDAIHDFQAILSFVLHQPDVIHPQLLGSTQLQLGRAQLALKHVFSGTDNGNALLLVDQAADSIGRKPLDDPYTLLVRTGTLSGLHQGGYHLIKASILNIAGSPDKALIELARLTNLTEQTYRQDETRYHAWSDITMAESLLRLEEYQEAMLKVKGALIACYHINSMQNVTMIADLYRRMSDGSSYTFVEAKEVGDMLTTWYGEEQKRDLLS